MNEYFALLIPIFFGIVMILFFSKKVTWWEMIVPTLVGLIIIFSMKSCDKASNVSDIEYLSQHVVTAVHEEEWNEWIKKTCSERYACGTESHTDSKGHTTTSTKYCTRYYDCSYCENHPEHWYIIDDSGEQYSISKEYYNKLMQSWHNETFVDMHRHYYTIDGNKYTTTWDKNKSTLVTTHRTHSYENKVQASHSIYNYADVNDSDKVLYKLFEYPHINNYQQNPIMTYNYFVSQKDQDYANTINGLLGKKKQVQYFVCIWKDKPYSSSTMQQAYWKGGNKNEIIVCIGVDKANKVTWTNVFTWSEKDIVRIKIRDYVLGFKGQVINLNMLTDYSYNTIESQWKRKNFHDFDFLEVDLTDTQVTWIYIIVIIFSLGLCVFAVLNDINPDYKTTQWEQNIKNKLKNKLDYVNRFFRKLYQKR